MADQIVVMGYFGLVAIVAVLVAMFILAIIGPRNRKRLEDTLFPPIEEPISHVKKVDE